MSIRNLNPMRCGVTRLLLLLITTVFLVMVGRYYLARSSCNKLYTVAEVNNPTLLKLDGYGYVRLANIAVSESKLDKAIERVRELVSANKVLLYQSDEPNEFNVFIWGTPDDILRRSATRAEVSAAKNVDVGFLNIQKGTCVHINEVLINEGLAYRAGAGSGD